jgi:hypothetical protein
VLGCGRTVGCVLGKLSFSFHTLPLFWRHFPITSVDQSWKNAHQWRN